MVTFLKGGYPEPIWKKKKDSLRPGWKIISRLMCKQISEHSSHKSGTAYKNIGRFVSMLASLSGTIINRSQAVRSLDISEKSVRDYFGNCRRELYLEVTMSYSIQPEQINRQDAERSLPGQRFGPLYPTN